MYKPCTVTIKKMVNLYLKTSSEFLEVKVHGVEVILMVCSN